MPSDGVSVTVPSTAGVIVGVLVTAVPVCVAVGVPVTNVPVGVTVSVIEPVDVGVTVAPVGVGVGVKVLVTPAGTVNVGVADGLLPPLPGVSVTVGVRDVAVAVGVLLGPGKVGVNVRVGVRVCVGVLVTVGVLVGVLVRVLVGVLVGVFVGVLVGVLVGVGDGAAVVTTQLENSEVLLIRPGEGPV